MPVGPASKRGMFDLMTVSNRKLNFAVSDVETMILTKSASSAGPWSSTNSDHRPHFPLSFLKTASYTDFPSGKLIATFRAAVKMKGLYSSGG